MQSTAISKKWENSKQGYISLYFFYKTPYTIPETKTIISRLNCCLHLAGSICTFKRSIQTVSVFGSVPEKNFSRSSFLCCCWWWHSSMLMAAYHMAATSSKRHYCRRFVRLFFWVFLLFVCCQMHLQNFVSFHVYTFTYAVHKESIVALSEHHNLQSGTSQKTVSVGHGWFVVCALSNKWIKVYEYIMYIEYIGYIVQCRQKVYFIL